MIARLALIGLLLATPALAQPGGPPGGPHPGGPPPGAPDDGDGDGRPPPLQIFITPAGEPFRAPLGAPYPVAAWFAGADADHDGVLTRDEFIADSLRFFAVLDVDHDGWIDGFEANDYEKTVAPEILSRAAMMQAEPRRGPRKAGIGSRINRPADDGKPYGLDRSGAGLYGLINEVEPVTGQDSDFNRRIDRKEATAAAKDRFRILDKDGDGKLTLDALPKTPMQKALEDGAAERPD
ncbi:MAG: hypothetical protein KF842_00460 [Caulobacter sp.]|nr:hypothetical protein [Caulobacter sp.]